MVRQKRHILGDVGVPVPFIPSREHLPFGGADVDRDVIHMSGADRGDASNVRSFDLDVAGGDGLESRGGLDGPDALTRPQQHRPP